MARYSIEMLSTLRPLNSNFFDGGTGESRSDRPTHSLDESTCALGSLIGAALDLRRVPYKVAVDEFEAQVGSNFRGLDYRLRTWFLLLVYDGFNQYCLQTGLKELTSLSESSLAQLIDADGPDPISRAAHETIAYIHRYPLKYFLDENSKISGHIACHLLHGISDLVLR